MVQSWVFSPQAIYNEEFLFLNCSPNNNCFTVLCFLFLFLFWDDSHTFTSGVLRLQEYTSTFSLCFLWCWGQPRVLCLLGKCSTNQLSRQPQVDPVSRKRKGCIEPLAGTPFLHTLMYVHIHNNPEKQWWTNQGLSCSFQTLRSDLNKGLYEDLCALWRNRVQLFKASLLSGLACSFK